MKYHGISFRYMLAISCFLIILFSILTISILAGLRMASIVEKDTKQTVQNIFEQSNLELTRQLDEVADAHSAAALDTNFIDAIRVEHAQDSLYNRYVNQNFLERSLKNICKNHPMIENAVLYTASGQTLYANNGNTLPYRKTLPEQSWFALLQSGGIESYQIGSFPLILTEAPRPAIKQVYLSAQRLYDYRDMRYLGVLVFAVDPQVFYDTIDKFPLPDGRIGLAILDPDNNVLHARGAVAPRFDELVLAREEQAADGAYLRTEARDYYVNSRKYDALGWSLISAASREYMMSDVKIVWSFTWKLALVVALFGGLFVILMVRRMHSPIYQIEVAIERFGSGVLDARVPDSQFTEFHQIGHRFNAMAVQIDSLIEKVRAAEREKQQIHLQMLEAQINPHFIYNTLDGIKWTAMMHGDNDVARMITSLVKLLRISVYTQAEYITVEAELEYLKNYLALIEMRYGAQITFLYEVDPSALACKTLKLVLQPLVENAIFHGIMDKIENGTIKVSCRMTNCLTLQVEDNGVGCTSTKRSQHGGDRFSGIGLENIDRRIKLWCGEEYGIAVSSSLGKGTLVTVKQPIRRDEHDTCDDC